MKRLLIIGANNFQLPLIKKAKDMGFETHVFAWEEGAVGKSLAYCFYPISITEKEKICDIARTLKPVGVISIASDLAAITVNYIADKLGLIGNSLESTTFSTDKYFMRSKLRSFSLPCPDFYLVDCEAQEYKKIQFPVIVKPTDRSGSRGVSKVESYDDLPNAVARAMDESFGKRVIVEEYIQGQEFSVEMISWKGEHHFLQITEKETFGPPYFVEKAHHQPAYLPDLLKQRMIDIVKKSLSALGVEYGASHSELMLTKDNQIYIVEIGARMGGDYIGSDLVQLSTGFDFLKATINIACGIAPKIELTKQDFSGIYYSNTKSGYVAEIIDRSQEYSEIVRKEIYVEKGQYLPQVRESNQRGGCAIYYSKQGRFVPNEEIIEILLT